MSNSLHDRLHRLRSRVRRVLCLYGMSWLVAVLLGATLAVAFVDWLLHLDDSGVRLILGLGILGGTGYVAWRCLLRPQLQPLSDVDLALRIERRFPGFNDSLASTVQFLEGRTDPRIGSPALQKHVIDRTLRDVERVELDDVVQTRPVRRAALVAGAVCLVVVVVAGLNRVEAATALHRLFFPFSTHPWPKTTELRLTDAQFRPLDHPADDPLLIARGSDLEVFVENLKGEPPDDLAIEFRTAEDDPDVAVEPMRRATVRDATGTTREVGVARIASSKGPLQFRAVGGDDREKPWQHLQVVTPPAVQNLQVTLTPPAYTGQPAETLPPGVGHVRGLIGTRVDVTGRFSKPVRRAGLRVKDHPPEAVETSGDDDRQFRTSFTIREAGVYAWWFDLEDRQGFTGANAPRYEIRGIADLPPEVTIEAPAADQQVTAEAVVPLRVSAKDDLGLRALRVPFQVIGTEPAPPAALELWTGEDGRQQHVAEQEWALAELALEPGMQIVFHGEAADACDVGEPRVGRSIERTLTVVGPEEKAAEIAERQGALIDELEAVREAQQAVREQSGQLLAQLRAAGELRPQDLDLLRRLEIDQRQIGTRLTRPVDGLEAQAEELKEELERNRVGDAAMASRLDQIAGELAVLREDHLPVAERDLTQARKTAQAATGDAPASADPEQQADALARAERAQRDVEESLGALLEQLAEWRQQRDLEAGLDDLTARQREINRLSSEVGRGTAGKTPEQLTPQEQAELARLAERQRNQADRLDQFARDVEAARQDAATPQPQADALQETAEQLRREATAGRMREAARNLDQNLIGNAQRAQDEALEDLQSLRETLHSRPTTDTQRLVEQLKETEEQAETLRKQQEELARQVEDALQNEDAGQREPQLEQLRKEQQALHDEAENLARRLRRLEAQDAAEAARRAAARMEQAADDLRDDLGEQARQEQQDVLDDLEQVRRDLARARQDAEEQLARELLERIGDQLASMIDRQQNVVEETVRLEEARRANGGTLRRSQLLTLRDLARTQSGLKDETDRLAEAVKGAEVFGLALEGAARDMQRAADRLGERLTDEETVRAEQAAVKRFTDLVAALEPAESEAQNQGQQQGGSQGGAAGGPPTDGIPHLAQLKMLRTLQSDVLLRTAELDQVLRNTGELSAEQRAELDQLALEQGRLADLTRNLTQQFVAPATARPDAETQESPE